ncbi:MAG: CHRD domain-containing protein, partial [Candidatus Eisenbacteria bacterium]|nr:CHRD domain-containing protein [Candidatus Eisenbacteria bacterium]
MHTDLVAQSGVATQRRRSILSVLPVLATIVATGSLLLATSSQAARFVYGAVLTEAQEVPPTGSAAFGSAQFVTDTDANTVTYRLAYGGLSAAETASHIHGPADPGTNAGVKTALPAGNVKTGVWNYAEADEGDILAGKMYCNVHSGNFPGGEIRGQIVPLNAQIDGAQENPPVPTTASGFAVFSIDRATNTLSYYISYAGLSSAETAAHIHGTALPGTNAGVLVALPAGNPKVGTFNYPENMEVPLLEGQT